VFLGGSSFDTGRDAAAPNATRRFFPKKGPAGHLPVFKQRFRGKDFATFDSSPRNFPRGSRHALGEGKNPRLAGVSASAVRSFNNRCARRHQSSLGPLIGPYFPFGIQGIEHIILF